MINDVLEVFKKEYKKYGDKLILDNYILKDGLYVKVDNEIVEYFIVINDKKESSNRHCLKDLDGNIRSDLYDWFVIRDYYSEWLNANKAFYDKKIHNINYLSFFVKVDSFFSDNEGKLLQKESLKQHYKNLCNYKKFKKPKEIESLNQFQNYLKDRKRRKDIISKYRFIAKNIDDIANIAKDNQVKNYIKIFFEVPIEQYQQESSIYYSIKIFNDIDYSQKIEEIIYGLSDSNMGLNAKKPFLAHKNRKLQTPFMITDSDAILIKKFFDWLKLQDGKDKYPNGEKFFIHRDFKEKDVILDFDYLPLKIEKFDNSILIINYLNIKDKEDYEIKDLFVLEEKVDEVFYNKQLKHNYFRDDLKVSDFVSKKLQQLIFETKYAMVNYFKKFDERGFYQVVKKYGTDFVIEHLRQNRDYKAKESLNLKFSLLQHKGEKV
ncbi:MAG: hypothetical protein IE881_03645, partial [Epsilonproteobacteria bacterium]|nr:hypothetical protein [Campylobacterota bacterium]